MRRTTRTTLELRARRNFICGVVSFPRVKVKRTRAVVSSRLGCRNAQGFAEIGMQRLESAALSAGSRTGMILAELLAKGEGTLSMKTRTTIAWLAIATLGFALSVASADDKPDATLKLSGGSVAAGIGYTWGGGTLTYKGKTYDVELSGLSIADVGATKDRSEGQCLPPE